MIEFLTSSAFAFIGAFVVASLILGAGTDWVRRQQVRDRHVVPDPSEGRKFVADHEQIAKRVIEVLSEHVFMEADAIRPNDRLEDDLDLDIAAAPELFFDLERAFRIDCHVDKFEVFEATTAGLDTVSEMIVYVVEKVEEARSKPPPAPRAEAGIDGVEIIGIGWFLGLVIMIVGAVIEQQRVMGVGLIIAFLPLTFGLGRVLVHVFRDLVRDFREIGLSGFFRHPLALVGWLTMVGTMLLVFVAFCFLLLHAFSASSA